MKLNELTANMAKVVKELEMTVVDVSILGAVALHSSLIVNPSYSEEEKEAILEEIRMDQIEDIITCQAINN